MTWPNWEPRYLLGFYQNRYCDLSIIGEIEILIAPLVIVFCVALEKGVINWNSEKEWNSLGQMQDRPVLTDLAAHSLFHCLPFRIAFLKFSWGLVRNKDLLFCCRGREEQLFAQSFIGTGFPGTSVPSNLLVLCLPKARVLGAGFSGMKLKKQILENPGLCDLSCLW